MAIRTVAGGYRLSDRSPVTNVTTGPRIILIGSLPLLPPLPPFFPFRFLHPPPLPLPLPSLPLPSLPLPRPWLGNCPFMPRAGEPPIGARERWVELLLLVGGWLGGMVGYCH